MLSLKVYQPQIVYKEYAKKDSKCLIKEESNL
jgi:hypothetical protein